jgi:DNA-binding NtrC family response regulator
VPPLRARRDDIPRLAAHFWATLAPHTGTRARLAPSLVDALAAYDWPGNVRELQNVMAAIAVAAPVRGLVGVEVLAGQAPLPAALPAASGRAAPLLSLDEARRRFEVTYVQAALERCGGRPGQTARELGLSRQGLAKLLARLGVSRPREALRT